MTLQLEAGKFYRARNGAKIGPMLKREGYQYPFFVEPKTALTTFLENGKVYHKTKEMLDYDIIAEWVDPAPATESNIAYYIVIRATDKGVLLHSPNAPYQHPTQAAAFAEATRLAKKDGGKFFVLRAEGYVATETHQNIFEPDF